VKLVVKGFQADSQDFGGPGFVVVHRVECLENQSLFRFLERGSEGNGDVFGALLGSRRVAGA